MADEIEIDRIQFFDHGTMLLVCELTSALMAKGALDQADVATITDAVKKRGEELKTEENADYGQSVIETAESFRTKLTYGR